MHRARGETKQPKIPVAVSSGIALMSGCLQLALPIKSNQYLLSLIFGQQKIMRRRHPSKYLLGLMMFNCIDQIIICFYCGCLTPWRNGSASDSRSEGCVFKSRRGQIFLVIRNNILTALINLLANKTSSVTGLEPAIPRSEVWCLIH